MSIFTQYINAIKSNKIVIVKTIIPLLLLGLLTILLYVYADVKYIWIAPCVIIVAVLGKILFKQYKRVGGGNDEYYGLEDEISHILLDAKIYLVQYQQDEIYHRLIDFCVALRNIKSVKELIRELNDVLPYPQEYVGDRKRSQGEYNTIYKMTEKLRAAVLKEILNIYPSLAYNPKIQYLTNTYNDNLKKNNAIITNIQRSIIHNLHLEQLNINTIIERINQYQSTFDNIFASKELNTLPKLKEQINTFCKDIEERLQGFEYNLSNNSPVPDELIHWTTSFQSIPEIFTHEIEKTYAAAIAQLKENDKYFIGTVAFTSHDPIIKYKNQIIRSLDNYNQIPLVKTEILDIIKFAQNASIKYLHTIKQAIVNLRLMNQSSKTIPDNDLINKITNKNEDIMNGYKAAIASLYSDIKQIAKTNNELQTEVLSKQETVIKQLNDIKKIKVAPPPMYKFQSLLNKQSYNW